MRRILPILFLFILLLPSQLGATVIIVENTNDSGTGSFRDAIAEANDGDTVLINVKGTIVLESSISISGFDSLTIIGPYAAHNTFEAGGTFSGSMLNISNSGNLYVKGLGFGSGNNLTRHISIQNCENIIEIERCLFQNNTVTSPSFRGACIGINAADVVINACSFIDNTCPNAAVSVIGYSSLIITNSTFSGNYATNKAGALLADGFAEVLLLHNTFVYNDAANPPVAICTQGNANVEFESNALADNGTMQQIGELGSANIYSSGGNAIKLNYLGEPTDLGDIILGDLVTSIDFTVGLRASIKEDGFGLKYWPIVDPLSDLINTKSATGTTPDFDCRNAPRALQGPGAISWPDAGACEYTHLRVTNTSGNPGDPNSFLWTLDAAQRKDEVHYIEFDIAAPDDILFESEGIAAVNAYIIDGFSQPESTIPGPHLNGTPGLTGAVLPIDFVDGTGNNRALLFGVGAQGSILQGVSVQGFDNYGVQNNVENVGYYGLEIGIDGDGVVNGNELSGIAVNSDDTKVGGWEHWQRNVSSGNGSGAGAGRSNILINDGANNSVTGNIIGGKSDGLSNTGEAQSPAGIINNAPHTVIGNYLINSGNIIVDNEYGIYFTLTGDSATVQNNKIGVGYDEITALGNSIAGIHLSGSDANLIGGYDVRYGNIIAYNNRGISMEFSGTIAEQNSILGNSIHSNVNQGIDIETDDLVLPNDSLIDLTQQNHGLDFPEILSSENCNLMETKTVFKLNVPIGEDYRIEFFSNTSPDPTNGEGEVFLQAVTVTAVTNPQEFTVAHGFAIPGGTSISATLTQLSTGNTSEFGTNTIVGALLDPSFSYDVTCHGTTLLPTITGDTGGTFRFASPEPVDGAEIDAVSGAISGAVEGETYSVIYGFSGLCENEDTLVFTVTEVDESFTFPDFCPGTNGLPDAIATPGGTFAFEPSLDDGSTITADEGMISGGIEGTTYTVRYIAESGLCVDTGYVDVLVTPTDESFTFEDFCPGITGVPTAVATEGGTFSFEFDPGDGASIDPDSGNLYEGIEGNSYPVIYTVGICNDKDTAYPTVITVTETFTFDDFCLDEYSPAPTPDGPMGSFSFGLPAPDDGASIEAATGIIHYPVEGSTYPVVQTVTEYGCTQSDTVMVSVNEIDETFDFEDFCFGETGVPTDISTPGGTFSFFVDPMDGASIDGGSGSLIDGTSGATYIIQYLVTVDECSDSSTVSVTVNDANASFIFEDFCPSDLSPEPVEEVEGGTFSFETPPTDGESIDPVSGIISTPIEGNTYNIIYSNTYMGCENSDTVTVSVHTVNEGFTFDDFCWADMSPAPLPEMEGGIFSFGTPPADDATIDPDDGIISSPSEGTTYEIVHTLTTDEMCTQFDTVFVESLGVDESFVFEDICPTVTSPEPIPAVDGGLYEFTPEPLDGATINSSTGEITGGIEGATYTVSYTVYDETGTCPQSSTETVTTITTNEGFVFPDFCAAFGGTPASIETEGGIFQFAPAIDGASIDASTGFITGAVAATTYSIEYTVGSCAEKDTVAVLAMASEDASFILDDFCSNIETSPEVTGTTGGQFDFYTAPGDATEIDPDTGIITNSEGGTYSIRYVTPGSATTCRDTIIKTVTLYEVPVILTLNSDVDIYCPDFELGPIKVEDHNGAFKVYWYEHTIDVIADSTFSYTPSSLNLGDNTFYAQPKNTDGCYGEFVTYNLFLSDTSNMHAASDFQICMGSSTQLSAYGGTSYNWETTALLDDYDISSPIAFSLNEEMYVVHIFNSEGCEVTDTLNIGFLPRSECEIEVFNAFSPNGDGKNDIWYIENLINFTPNTVYIYSRWGDQIREIQDYDNITAYWDGTDANGNELPPGTYFYVVISDDPNQNQAAWVQLVR